MFFQNCLSFVTPLVPTPIYTGCKCLQTPDSHWRSKLIKGVCSILFLTKGVMLDLAEICHDSRHIFNTKCRMNMIPHIHYWCWTVLGLCPVHMTYFSPVYPYSDTNVMQHTQFSTPFTEHLITIDTIDLIGLNSEEFNTDTLAKLGLLPVKECNESSNNNRLGCGSCCMCTSCS